VAKSFSLQKQICVNLWCNSSWNSYKTKIMKTALITGITGQDGAYLAEFFNPAAGSA
jgi:hypothetical protein